MTSVAVSFDTTKSRRYNPFRAVFRNASLRVGLSILAALIAFSVIGSLVLVDPAKQRVIESSTAPSWNHPFGTDQLGRDILSWTAGGIRSALFVSLAVVALSAFLGVAVGLFAGYFRGATDMTLMRVVDLQLALPPLIVFIAAAAVLAPTMTALIILLSLFSWVPYARLVRARVLSERERAFVAAARLGGARLHRLLFVHLLPQAMTQILVLASVQAGLVLLWESGLSFLGLGIRPPTPSLGYMVELGRSDPLGSWWIFTFPGAFIVLLVLAFNLIGDGLRDLFHLDDAVDQR